LRVSIYVDGFNLYYRGLRSTDAKWLDIKKLAESVLAPTDQVLSVKYFTADVSPRGGDPDAPQRQKVYLRALKTAPEVEIIKGRFLSKTKKRPTVADPKQYVEVHDTEEKGSDVNLASHLLVDGFRRKYDLALVLSQDTDLLEPIRMVKNDLKLKIGVLWFDQSKPGRKFQENSDFIRHVDLARLRRCQFPNPVTTASSEKLFRPASW